MSQQIALLQSRGMVINDQAFASHFLTHVGYYRLAGYWQIFQTDPIKHIFRNITYFEDVIALYDFDRELRLLAYDAIERIEISFRTLMADHLCMSYGPHWYTDQAYAQDAQLFQANKSKIEEELDRSKEEFIKHHDQKYGKAFPPAWMTLQVLSFGTLSKVYNNLSTKLPEKNSVARAMGLPNYTYFASWMLSISIIRNFCAHHSRIINRKFDFPPQKLMTSPHPWITKLPVSSHFASLLYHQLCSLKFLMDRVSPGNHFSQKLKALIAKYPRVSLINMGFSTGWEQEQLWR